jgi:hypothetical protein
MNFDVKRPCSNCPFRLYGAIELRNGRLAQIVHELRADDHKWFICHKTIGRGSESQCVGAMVYLLKIDAPSVSMRVAAAVGLIKFADLRAQYPEIIEPLKGEN